MFKKTMVWTTIAIMLAISAFSVGCTPANAATSSSGTLTPQPTAQATAPSTSLWPPYGFDFQYDYGPKWKWDDDGPIHFYVVQAFAEKTGLSVDQVNAQLAAGKPLAQLALEQGIQQDNLRTFLLEVYKLGLDKAVAAGVITQVQADWMYQRLEQRPWMPGPHPRYGYGPMWGWGRDSYGPILLYVIQAFAEKTGLSVDQVNAQLAAGKPLAQIALEQGIGPDNLPTFLLEVYKLGLDKAVAAGVITQEQADWMYQRWQGWGFGPGRCPQCGYGPGPGRGRGWGRWKNPNWGYPSP